MKKRDRLNGKTVEIGGLLYKVKYVGKKPIKDPDALMIKGEIDFCKRTIEIEKGLSPSEEIETILHELVHGTLDAFIPAVILDKYRIEEELIVGPFSRILAGALRSAGLLK